LAKESGWFEPTGAFATVHDAPKPGVDFSRFMRTDAGNALAFLELFGDDLRFVEKWGCWLAWDGARWAETSDLAIVPLARRATEETLKWAFAQPSGTEEQKQTRDAWIKHAVATQKGARLREMINLAKGEARARIEPDALDADPWLLGCSNGTLDLRTGKLREARRDDYITKQIGVAFDSEADCPQWRGFLDFATKGDRELAAFLQAFAGYALTGEISEEKMCAFVGDGANGKSTFMMTLRELWGEYAVKVNSDLLVHAQGKEGAPSPDVAALHGKRLVITSETEDGCSLSEARIKDLVSNEDIAACRKYRDPFTFRPTHKIMLGTNYQPHVKGTDSGIWRRLALVHFNATVEEEEKIADFREKFLWPELLLLSHVFRRFAAPLDLVTCRFGWTANGGQDGVLDAIE
jgi:putative DNA primase/helicase